MVDLSEFKVSHYPDGHKHVVSDLDLKGDTGLSASIRNFDDLFLIAQVKAIHPELTHLSIKYLLAGRCDRRFSPGEALDLRIVCNAINSLNFESVAVLKPHSTKTIEFLQNASARDVTPALIRMHLDDIQPTGGVCYVSPDAGASNWIYEYNFRPIIQCVKKRNGNDITIELDLDGLDHYSHFVIVDDLCDGGKTFTTIAETIKASNAAAKIYLVITHAIFSKGLEPFEGLIERIYCTDSFGTFDNPLVKQLKV